MTDTLHSILVLTRLCQATPAMHASARVRALGFNMFQCLCGRNCTLTPQCLSASKMGVSPTGTWHKLTQPSLTYSCHGNQQQIEKKEKTYWIFIMGAQCLLKDMNRGIFLFPIISFSLFFNLFVNHLQMSEPHHLSPFCFSASPRWALPGRKVPPGQAWHLNI